jgi:hypothetical protein
VYACLARVVVIGVRTAAARAECGMWAAWARVEGEKLQGFDDRGTTLALSRSVSLSLSLSLSRSLARLLARYLSLARSLALSLSLSLPGANCTVRGITLSTQNCAQAGSQRPRPLPHMNLNVTERRILSELRGAGFNLQEVIPPELESAARLGRRTRGAGLRQLEGVGRKRFVLSSDDDNELRSRCE